MWGPPPPACMRSGGAGGTADYDSPFSVMFWSPFSLSCFPPQVEARMRQLEGKVLATEGAKPRGKEQPAKYDKTKQGAAPALASQAKAYNADADVATESKEDKKKKVCMCWKQQAFHLAVSDGARLCGKCVNPEDT